MNLSVKLTTRFLIQLVVLAVLVGLVSIGTLVLSSRLYVNQLAAAREPAALLKMLPAQTDAHGPTLSVSPAVLQPVVTVGGWLQILDSSGHVIYAYATPSSAPLHYDPGALAYDLKYQLQLPGSRGYHLYTWYDRVEGRPLTWLLAYPIDHGVPGRVDVLSALAIMLAGTLVVVLIVGLFFGRQLAQPLLHMMRWLQAIASGSFDEPVDPAGWPRSKRRNRSGLRRSYRVYSEVIASLEHLTATLRRADRDRQRLEQTREEWISGVSHDLKTPLSSVRGYGELLASDQYDWSDGEVRRFGRVIADKANYMDGMLSDLSLTYQLKNRSLPIVREPVNAVEVVRRAVIDLVNNPKFAEQTIQFHCDADVIVYPLDEQWFLRALENLMANAAIHNPPGTTIEVSLRLQIDPIESDVGSDASPVGGGTTSTPMHGIAARYPGLMIRISDNGRGMDEETVAHLFDRYYRGTNTENERGTGSGLGTAIAKQLIQAHEGDITVQSRVGVGTTVIIRLPEN